MIKNVITLYTCRDTKKIESVMYLSLASKSAFIPLGCSVDLVRRGQITNMSYLLRCTHWAVVVEIGYKYCSYIICSSLFFPFYQKHHSEQ